MGELHIIESALRRANRRRRWMSAWAGFWKGLLVGSILWAIVYAVYKVYPIPAIWLTVAAAVAAACVLAGTVLGLCKKLTLVGTAKWLDNRQRLQERLSTALELSRNVGGSE